MGVRIQIKMGHPLAQNGAALAPFRANGAHPSHRLYRLRNRDWKRPFNLLEAGVHNAKAEECTTPYMRQNIKMKYWRGWFTWQPRLLKYSPDKISWG